MSERIERQNKRKKTGTGALGALALAGAGVAGGWIVYSATMIDHDLPLPLAINSEKHLFTGRISGLLNYYADESDGGRPLVLVHSINAAASSYEMRPIFDYYRDQRAVYALDLPGFGFSERSNRHYSPKLFSAAIADFLRDIVEEPADVIALSLSSEFAATAALEQPELFHSLTLISPTGLSDNIDKRGSQESPEKDNSQFLLNLFSFPLWSQALYDLLATRASIRYFLDKSFYGAPDEGLAAYSYLSAHQPNARFAPLHFISGKLFTPDVLTEVYEKVNVPSLIVYDQDAYTTFDALPDLLLRNPGWSAVRITPTRGLPQFEQMEALARVVNNFWKRAGAG
ncbi:MAG TPA: alpha/beta hydrolase [Candidatus Sulfomarinibacteraceae bacterium]|nr:alpha/beta hydrolase [Candidatus Sulfomarinibacteraceae bacterium]